MGKRNEDACGRGDRRSSATIHEHGKGSLARGLAGGAAGRDEGFVALWGVAANVAPARLFLPLAQPGHSMRFPVSQRSTRTTLPVSSQYVAGPCCSLFRYSSALRLLPSLSHSVVRPSRFPST